MLRIVFGGRAVLLNADRISNDGARTLFRRVRLCFAVDPEAGVKESKRCPNNRRAFDSLKMI